MTQEREVHSTEKEFQIISDAQLGTPLAIYYKKPSIIRNFYQTGLLLVGCGWQKRCDSRVCLCVFLAPDLRPFMRGFPELVSLFGHEYLFSHTKRL